MLQFQSLTNKKNTKTYSESVVIAGPTPGELKLTPMAAEKLGLVEGDNVAVVVANGKVYLGKGINGTPIIGEDGKQLKTKTGKKVCQPNSSFGATLGSQENSVLLKCSAQAGWDTLGGKETANIYFSIDEPVEGQVPTGNKDASGEDIMHTAEFFGLTFKEEKAKAPRKDKGEEDTDRVETPIAVSANTTEEVSNGSENVTMDTPTATLNQEFEDVEEQNEEI